MSSPPRSMSPRVVESRDAKETALIVVLSGGLNRVLWDECQPIWDSRDLIEDSPTGENMMAIFGVKGKIETREHRHLDFQVRYTVDFGLHPTYRLHAAVTGPASDCDGGNQVDIIQSDLNEGSEQRRHFREAIMSLTQKFHSAGLDATIKSFMTPRSAVNGVSGG